jgi:hypothetical protein
MQTDVFLEQRHRSAPDDRCIRIGAGVGREQLDGRTQVPPGPRVPRHASASDAVDEHLCRAAGQLRRLENPRGNADALEISGRRLLNVPAPLRHEQDHPPIGHRRLHRRQRSLSPHEQRHDRVGKYDEIPERQDRQALGDGEGLGVAAEGSHGRAGWPTKYKPGRRPGRPDVSLGAPTTPLSCVSSARSRAKAVAC